MREAEVAVKCHAWDRVKDRDGALIWRQGSRGVQENLCSEQFNEMTETLG